MLRVPINPEMLRWARERADIRVEDLVHRFPKYMEWELGEIQPTLNQLESFSNTTHAPFGYFFFSKPPEYSFPISDFRTVGNVPLKRPSLDLLHTVFLCQRRQDWYREFAISAGEGSVPFVGSETIDSDINEVSKSISETLKVNLGERRKLQSWSDLLRYLITRAEEVGVLVMVSGVVGNNTHRKLNPDEFRGFSLIDDYAPLVFINGSDSRAAQIFTLIHELAHVWLGESALSNVGPETRTTNEVESWCNCVAAEVLVPISSLTQQYRKNEQLPDALSRLARYYKVSTLVVLRRLYDYGKIGRDTFWKTYQSELKRVKFVRGSAGGNFTNLLTIRVSRRFGQALVESTLEGHTTYSEALRLLNVKRMSTFHSFAKHLEKQY